jgi:hypothetical protein
MMVGGRAGERQLVEDVQVAGGGQVFVGAGQRQGVHARRHAHGIGAVQVVGGQDGLAQRAVGIAGAVGGVGGLGDGEDAARRQGNGGQRGRGRGRAQAA